MTRFVGVDRDRGAAAVILVLLTPMFFALAGLVLDGGRAITARQRAADLAEQAARAGVDALDVTAFRATGMDVVDPAAGAAAACGFVHASEPADGCTARVSGATVTVVVTNRTPTVLLGLIGINSFHASATATAAPEIGVRTKEGP
jgi:Flp pilus assembly protein TadG